MTLDTPRALAPAERLRWLEDPGRDLPFYNGTPVGPATGKPSSARWAGASCG